MRGPSAASTSSSWGTGGDSGVERIEVLDHLREGTAVLLIAALHGRRVAHAEPEEEPSGMRRRQLRVPSRDVVRLVHPHVEDAGGHDGAGRRVEEPSRIAEHLTAGAARDPQRPVAEPLELRGRVRGFSRIAASQNSAPDADARPGP